MGARGGWAIILAAGDGRRVAALTGDDRGAPLPKQYCSFGEAAPMLRWTVDRAHRSVAPGFVITVVAEQHREHWGRELADMPPDNILAQPCNRGTAPGLLLPLLNILGRDPDATVVVLPSDHYVADERSFAESVRAACRGIGGHSNRVVLLGMKAAEPEPECGWILPDGDAEQGLSRVASFVEKPGTEGARRLMRLGGLVNAFVLVTAAKALLRLYSDALPWLVSEFARHSGAPTDPASRAALYGRLPTADFSRDVLERVPGSLLVFAAPDCGWCDLGTPEAVRRFLDRPGPRRPHPRLDDGSAGSKAPR
jgi:mannose-1-phosphate guanylyltransferase